MPEEPFVVRSLDAEARLGTVVEPGARPGERALLAAGDVDAVERAHAEANAFAEEHAVALGTLRDDVVGDFRQGGRIRLMPILLIFPLGLPFGVHVVRNIAGRDLEWLGFVASVLCVLLAAILATLVRGRALDRTTLTIVGAATASVVAGAAMTWWILGSHWLSLASSACAVAMVVLLAVLVTWRVRGGAAGRLRDREAMDRARELRVALRTRLAASLPSRDGTAPREPFVEELVARVVPMPTRRVFADARTPEQRAADEAAEPGAGA